MRCQGRTLQCPRLTHILSILLVVLSIIRNMFAIVLVVLHSAMPVTDVGSVLLADTSRRGGTRSGRSCTWYDAYTAKSNTRNRTLCTVCTSNVAFCVSSRGILSARTSEVHRPWVSCYAHAVLVLGRRAMHSPRIVCYAHAVHTRSTNAVYRAVLPGTNGRGWGYQDWPDYKVTVLKSLGRM